jgi:Ca2+/Na+ antiporter
MSFREKTAWVTLIAILFVSALFFAHGPDFVAGNVHRWELHLLAFCIFAFIVIEVVAYAVLYVKYPKDARTPKDERERLIDLKALRLAAYVYVLGSFLAIIASIHAPSGGIVGFFVLAAFVVAEIVNYAARIIYYRRGF